MVKVLDALYDGKSFHPVESLELQPNTRVRITIEWMLPQPTPPRSFLQTARSFPVDGPADWSSNLDAYLYGSVSDDHDQ